MRMSCFAALAVALLTGCSGLEDLPPLDQSSTLQESYRLDTGDELRISVFNQDQLTGNYKVGANGAISMPLIGEVAARGLTTGELEKALVNRLSVDKSLLVDPSVSVQVQAYRPFFILGEVKSPGQYPCPYDTTVLSAVAMAGGFTYHARTDYVSITRKKGDRIVEQRAERNSVIAPGDVVVVYERYF